MSKWESYKKESTSSGSTFNREFIESQLPVEESVDAVIAAVIDLGVQEQGIQVGKKNPTYFATKDEAFDFVDSLEDSIGKQNVEKDNLDSVEEVGEVWVLPFKVVNDKWVFPQNEENPFNMMYVFSEDELDAVLTKAKKLDEFGNLKGVEDSIIYYDNAYKTSFSLYNGGQEAEVGIIADFTSNPVQYVEDDEESARPYRLHLSGWDKEQKRLKGFPIKFDKDTGTFSSKSNMYKLIKATGNSAILEDGKNKNNLDLLAGTAYFQPVVADQRNENQRRFPKDFGMPRQKDRDGIAPLDIKGYEDGIVITFSDEVDDIVAKMQALYLDKRYINVIKKALNYEGSNMKKAIELYEGGVKAPTEAVQDDEGESKAKVAGKVKTATAKPQEATEASARKVTRKSVVQDDDVEEEVVETKPKRVVRKPDPEPEVEEVDEDDVSW